MPVSRMINCCSASRPSMTISSGPVSRWASSVSEMYLILSSASDAFETSSRTRDLPALIERMRQQVKYLLDLGLKGVFLAIDDGRHGFDPSKTCLIRKHRLTSRLGARKHPVIVLNRRRVTATRVPVGEVFLNAG